MVIKNPTGWLNFFGGNKMTREEEIRQYLKERNIPITSLEANSIIEGAKWADRTLIEKACKWMREEFYTSKDRDGHNILVSASCDNVEELIKDFEKQMEE